jgi:hypothetical protein
MIFRLYHETRGGHVHCRLFAGQHEGALGKCGDLVFRSEEFATFVKRFAFIELREETMASNRIEDWQGSAMQRQTDARNKDNEGYFEESHVGNGNNQTEYTGR